MKCSRPTSALRNCRSLHRNGERRAKLGALDFGSTLHLAGEVVSHGLRGDHLVHRGDDLVSGLGPAHVPEHHLAGEDERTGVDLVETCVLRRRPVGRLEHRDAGLVVDVRAGRDADAADRRCESVGNVVAVEVQCRNHVVLRGARQNLLEERVADAVLHHDHAAGLRVLELAPRSFVDQGRAVLALRELVAPVAERTLGELLDVALVDERHRLAVVVDRVVERRLHEALGALERDRLDANRRRLREADLLYAHLAKEKRLDLLDLGSAVHPLDAGVDVLRVLAEDHHVGELGALHGRGNSLEPADRPQAHIEVELLTHRDVDGADSAADRSRERALDRDEILAARVQGRLRKPLASLLERLLAREDFLPLDLALATVCLFDRGVPHRHRGARDVRSCAVALDVGNYRVLGNAKLPIIHCDLFAHDSQVVDLLDVQVDF